MENKQRSANIFVSSTIRTTPTQTLQYYTTFAAHIFVLQATVCEVGIQAERIFPINYLL